MRRGRPAGDGADVRRSELRVQQRCGEVPVLHVHPTSERAGDDDDQRGVSGTAGRTFLRDGPPDQGNRAQRRERGGPSAASPAHE